jgi:putative nucleotidyltransferase with HDIG domain
VLYADNLSKPGAFIESDLDLLALIGNQAGMAIQRARLQDELEQSFFDTIRAIVATIDAKDGYTHRHSERVATFAVRLARELGRDTGELRMIRLAAMVHDVGKVGVPEAILNKPGQLTEAEFDQMKQHPIHGANILRHIQSPLLERILPGVLAHHERWDGSGYPRRLAGPEIPFLGRLLAVADVLDALSSGRPYRDSMTFADAIELLERRAGIDFDPEIVAAAGALHQRGELEVPTESLEPQAVRPAVPVKGSATRESRSANGRDEDSTEDLAAPAAAEQVADAANDRPPVRRRATRSPRKPRSAPR